MFIAECGINHNGNIKTAYNLIDKAIWAGADAVKFQTINGIYRLSDYSLSYEDFEELKFYCDENNITFLSTPHTFDAIDFLYNLVPIYKVASTYMSNPNFLMEIADLKKPILLSTGNMLHNNGMSTDEEIRNALSYISDADITLMHCVSKYPCSDPHYERIEELKQFGFPVGLSDHSKNTNIPKDLPVVEKHMMLEGISCINEGVSLTPKEFKEMIDNY